MAVRVLVVGVVNVSSHKKALPYCLGINNLLQLPNTRTEQYGNGSLSFRGTIIWNQLPYQYKAAKTDNEFKMKIRRWKGFECICRICIWFFILYCSFKFSF